MADPYAQIIAQIDRTIARAGERLEGLSNNLNRAVSVLLAAHPNGLPSEERGVLLAFEVLCVESLWRNAWLLHARGENDEARRTLEIARVVQESIEEATRG